MITFASCVGYPDKLRDFADPGVKASMGDEPYEYWQMPSNGTDIYPVYGAALHLATETKPEALVLLHDDLELRDPEFASKVRTIFADDPSIAIIGCIGARHVQTLRWWQGERFGAVLDEAFGVHDFGFDKGSPCDVDSVDGMLLILSPWAYENLKLEGLGYEGFHGYDAELCFQANAEGKRVVVADIKAFHHSKGGFTGDTHAWIRAQARFACRWFGAPEPFIPGIGTYHEKDLNILRFDDSETVRVGNYCSIAGGVTLLCGGGHRTSTVSTWPFDAIVGKTSNHASRTYKKATPTVIGHDVWIAQGAMVMPGLKIGNGAVIGPGAVVFDDVEPYAVVRGNPARIVRWRFKPEVVDALERIAWWNWTEKTICQRVEDFYMPVEEFVRTYDRA